MNLKKFWVVFGDSAHLACSTRRAQIIEKFSVHFFVLTPLGRDIILVIDGFHWTNGFTRSAIDAFIWLDIHHAIAFIDAVNWALFNT